MCVTQHIIPYHMSGKKFFGRSAIRDVTDKRLPLLNEYLKVRTLVVFFISTIDHPVCYPAVCVCVCGRVLEFKFVVCYSAPVNTGYSII